MNGYDYTQESDNLVFTFVGTGTVFSYWPYIVGVMLGVLALIALIMFCSALYANIPQPETMEMKRKARASGEGHKPHTLRDEYGFYRTRGFFPEKDLVSPSPGGRSYVQNQKFYPGQSIYSGYRPSAKSPAPNY